MEKDNRNENLVETSNFEVDPMLFKEEQKKNEKNNICDDMNNLSDQLSNSPKNEESIEVNNTQEDCGDWYVAKATPFHEKSAIEWLKLMSKDENCEDDIKEYFIPQVEIKNENQNSDGSSKNEKVLKSFMIGYFAVKINLSSSLKKVLYKIQRSPNSKYKIIIFRDRKMTKKELEQMQNSSKFVKLSEFSIYQPGDEVIITHESFPNMVGCVSKVDEKNQKVSVILDIFGRSVSMELCLSKVKKKK